MPQPANRLPHHVTYQPEYEGDLNGLSGRVGGMKLNSEASKQSLPIAPTNIDALLDGDTDDELPPPPPALSSQQFKAHSSDGGLQPSASSQAMAPSPSDGTLRPIQATMQYLPSGNPPLNQNAAIPPPANDVAAMAASITIASFSATTTGLGLAGRDDIAAIDADDEGSAQNSNRNDESRPGNLLMEIQSGIKLKKVERQKEMEEVKTAAESNDVAAILRRRMEHVLGCNDESSESSNSNDGEWD